MTTQQTFYAVLDEAAKLWIAGNTNANKAERMAESVARETGEVQRVIAYTVIATFGGTDDR